MSPEDESESSSERCHMCLAIPGKIIEIASDNLRSALVDVLGYASQSGSRTS